MRSMFGSHVAGFGARLAFYEKEETHNPFKKQHVILPHDPERMSRYEFDRLCRELSGDVKVYYLGDLHERKKH